MRHRCPHATRSAIAGARGAQIRQSRRRVGQNPLAYPRDRRGTLRRLPLRPRQAGLVSPVAQVSLVARGTTATPAAAVRAAAPDAAIASPLRTSTGRLVAGGTTAVRSWGCESRVPSGVARDAMPAQAWHRTSGRSPIRSCRPRYHRGRSNRERFRRSGSRPGHKGCLLTLSHPSIQRHMPAAQHCSGTSATAIIAA